MQGQGQPDRPGHTRSVYSRVANATLFPLLDATRRIPISRELRFLEQSQWWSRDRIRAHQGEALARLIAHAYEHVPYYSRVMQERGLRPRDFTSPDDLVKLPVLTKDSVRAHLDDFVSRAHRPSDLIPLATGGSTGEPMRFYVDRHVRAMNQAAFWRGLSWAGLHRGERILMFSGGSMGTQPKTLSDRAKASVARQFLYPAFDVTRENLPAIVALIKRSRPKAAKGYVSTLLALARLMREAGIDDVHIPIVYTTAEMLYPDRAGEIAAAFGAEVLEYYGCGEVMSIGFQTGAGEPFIVSDEKVIVETDPLEDLRGASPREGAPGCFLLTDLTNYAFPFIRYQNGDAGVVSTAPDSSGRGLSRITSLEGRLHDFVTTTSGDLLSGAFFSHMFHFVEGVEYFQAIQDAPDHLTLKAVANEAFDAKQRDFLTRKIKEHAGEEMRVDIELVDEIPRTRSGKLRGTVSLLDETPGSASSRGSDE